jgi:DNA helicase-2/ATP-dependent DNA helicase PcrA
VLNAVDFGDLLLPCRSLFRDNRTCWPSTRSFKYMLVDEYQDTNTAQYLWLRLLPRATANRSGRPRGGQTRP